MDRNNRQEIAMRWFARDASSSRDIVTRAFVCENGPSQLSIEVLSEVILVHVSLEIQVSVRSIVIPSVRYSMKHIVADI
jgi:hypothetical protein